MQTTTLSAALLCCLAQSATANEFETAMRDFVDQNVAGWATSPILVQAIKAQNTSTTLLPQTTIDEMDATWRVQANSVCGGALLDVLSNPAAAFLRERVAATDGAITEALLMDARGLNVAATRPTTDYWQGDEAKYTATYLVGPGGVHYGEIELDESTQQVQGQVSMTITDQSTGEPIGALTIGINLTALM
ncbi:MAG: hypothetical protein AAFQ64_08910 [Pseudomonadota bacterium]